MIQAYLSWLYLPPARTNAIRRLVGLIAIPMLLIVWVWEKGGPGPITVPAWRWGGVFLQPPALPEMITNQVFIIAALAGLLVALGFKSRLLLAVIFCTFAYFAPRDLVASSPHYIIMETCFLFALLLDQPLKSPTRRMIQLSIFTCYFLAGFNKLIHPAWMSGSSLYFTFIETAHTHPEVSFLASLNQPVCLVLSWAVAFWEVIIAFALFSDRCRKVAIISGVLFHLCTLCLDPLLIMFVSLMFAGYLSYLPEKPPAAAEQPEPSPPTPEPGEPAEASEPADESPETKSTPDGHKPGFVIPILATAYLALIFAVPLRTFFWSGRPFQLQSASDRMPWSFHLFAAGMEKVDRISARWQDSSSRWHDFPVEGRLKDSASDNNIYRIINHIFATRDDVRQVHIELVSTIGGIKQSKSVDTTAPTSVKEPAVRISNSAPVRKLAKDHS